MGSRLLQYLRSLSTNILAVDLVQFSIVTRNVWIIICPWLMTTLKSPCKRRGTESWREFSGSHKGGLYCACRASSRVKNYPLAPNYPLGEGSTHPSPHNARNLKTQAEPLQRNSREHGMTTIRRNADSDERTAHRGSG